jgi:hypothetical protein
MKFKKLDSAAEILVRKTAKGKKIKPEKVKKLQQLLGEKKSAYEEKLKTSMEPGKREKLEMRLKVVEAHIEKANQL